MLPVSVKAVVGPTGSVVLLHNERDEWELPGGRLESSDANLVAALERELLEELGLAVRARRVVHAWRYDPLPGRAVMVVAFACDLEGDWPDELRHSAEHDDVGVFSLAELEGLRLPSGYREAIALAHSL